jgi:hypothetical protein
MKLRYCLYLLPALALGLAACESEPPATDEDMVPHRPPPRPNPQAEWWENMQALCGNAYAGEMVQYDEEADQGWLDVDVIMHVRECS